MPITSRAAALVAGASLALTGVVATPAAAAPDPSPVDQGVSWLSEQDFYSPGARIDVLQQLALLDRLGGSEAAAQLAAVKSGASGYATSAEASAKVSFAGDLVDENASTWGAGDLVQKVADGVDDTTGRIEGDYVTPASQALALRALGAFRGRTAHAEYATARDYLLTQQCADGRFRDGLAATSCDADQAAGSADATAFVVLYLGDSADPALTTSVAKARTWLASAQLADGSWKSPDQSWGAGVSNANSTGLAALALGAGPDATEAAAWLRRVQARDAGTCTTAIAAKDRGAIAFTAADYKAGEEAGLDEGQFTRGGWVFATQQSVAALRWAPQVTGKLNLYGVNTYVRAGSYVRLQVRNVTERSRACLTGPAGAKQRWESSSAATTRTVRLPLGTANRTYRLTDSAGRTDTHVLKAVGRKRLKVTVTKAKVRRGGWEKVRVAGLAPYERVAISYRGKWIRNTYSNGAGTYVTSFRVGKAKGARTVKAIGKYGAIRNGSAGFRVIR